ncbi:MAG: HEAT repeat domain-containing protein [Alkalispirochaeta sp.]
MFRPYRSIVTLLVLLAGLGYHQPPIVGSQESALGDQPPGNEQDQTDSEETAVTDPQVSDDEREQMLNTLQEWRETLLYGIKSEILELFPTLIENQESELVPEVMELFESSNDSEILAAAADYLTELDSVDGHSRAQELLQVGERSAAGLPVSLMRYLRETEAELEDETVDSLIEVATTGATRDADAAVQLLGASREVTSERLVELYQDQFVSGEIKGRILIELGRRGDPDVFDFVSEIIQEGEEAQTTLQRYAIDTLGKLGDPRALPTILSQFDSSDAMTRAYAVNALANFDTPEANRALVDSLRDDFWRVRVAALETIAERKMTDALSAVMYKARRDPEKRVRLEAVKTVAALDQTEGWELLRERFQEERTAVDERGAIADELIRHNLGQSLDTILEVVESEWDEENSRVLDTIGRIISQVENPEIEPIATRYIDHPNFILQIYGLRAVARSRLTGLAEITEERQEEGNHRAVRQAAARALEQIGTR